MYFVLCTMQVFFLKKKKRKSQSGKAHNCINLGGKMSTIVSRYFMCYVGHSFSNKYQATPSSLLASLSVFSPCSSLRLLSMSALLYFALHYFQSVIMFGVRNLLPVMFLDNRDIKPKQLPDNKTFTKCAMYCNIPTILTKVHFPSSQVDGHIIRAFYSLCVLSHLFFSH